MKLANLTLFITGFICLTSFTARAADRTLTFGVIAKANNNPVFQVVKVSSEAEAKKLTAEKGVEVRSIGGLRMRKIRRSRRRLLNNS